MCGLGTCAFISAPDDFDKLNLPVTLRDQLKAKAPTTPPLPKRLSLVAQTVQSLRHGICAGHWKEHLPGERKLCEHLQVSRRTLRAALNQLQQAGWLAVATGQRRKIKPRRVSRMAGAKKKVVAVLSPRSILASLPPTTFVMDALRDQLTEAGCVVEFHVDRACFSAQPAHALGKLIHEHPADAWLVLGSKEPMQRWFIRQRLPCLVAGSCAPAIALPSVDVDYRAACRHAGGVLWRKGHRRIALVLPQDAYGGDVISEEGLRESLRDLAGAHLQLLRHDGTATHLCALLDKAMRAPNPPTAYLVAHAMQVLAVMMHLLRRGKRIPQDMAVVSRDDDPFLQATSPVVARYAINPAQIARRISKAVRQLAETGALPAQAIRLMPTFIAGETV
jgi:DNA-binding LacI/PurR family transcriptional regulator